MEFLQEAGVNVLPRPPRSEELNSCDMVLRRLFTLHHPPQTLPQLFQEVQLSYGVAKQIIIFWITC